jgi:RHS repeat-associated protein
MTYDLDYRLKSIATSGIQSLVYTLNANNEITRIANSQQSAATQDYAYDALSRLKGVTKTGSGGNEAFTFDPNGNRLTHTKGGLTDTYYPEPANNQVWGIAGGTAATSKSMPHDGVGNITSYQTGTGTPFLYGFDPFNRLKTVTNGANVTTYHYDSSNQRVRKTGSVSGDIRYLHAGALLAETAAGSAALSTFYIRLGGEVIGLIKGSALYYVHNDHLGRPEVVTDQTKTKRWVAANYAYDRTVVVCPTCTLTLNVGFPGQYFDAESGLWYNHNRYYDASTGRYITSDPIGLKGGLNTYAYVGGAPVSSVDEDGLCPRVVTPVGKPTKDDLKTVDAINAELAAVEPVIMASGDAGAINAYNTASLIYDPSAELAGYANLAANSITFGPAFQNYITSGAQFIEYYGAFVRPADVGRFIVGHEFAHFASSRGGPMGIERRANYFWKQWDR